MKERTQQRYKLASETDALTGVPNRRAFLVRLDAHLTAGSVKGALLYLDIDHFKAINDRFGHAAGDQVLIEFADIISKAVPDDAFIARIGGEEFSAYLPHADRPGAIAIAERIRASLEARRLGTAKGVLSATVSIGVAFADGHEDSHALISAADAALYAAKTTGRNAVWSMDITGVPRFSAGPATGGGAVFAEILKGRLSAEIAEPLLIFPVVGTAP